MTQGRILAASIEELETQGITRYRVKRVAAAANVSVSLLYSYFEDREGLLAQTIVRRYRDEVLRTATRFTAPLVGVASTEELCGAMRQMIDDAERPERYHSRGLRVESFSFARHNQTAAEGIAAAQREAGNYIVGRVQPVVDRGLLPTGMSAASFARIWYALFFGQVALECEHSLAAPPEEWRESLYAIAEAMITRSPG